MMVERCKLKGGKMQVKYKEMQGIKVVRCKLKGGKMQVKGW